MKKNNVNSLNLVLILILAIVVPIAKVNVGNTSSGLSITAMTNSASYLLRQNVSIAGNLTSNGAPANNLVVALEGSTPLSTPLFYRVLQVGTPTQQWQVSISNLFLLDRNGNPIDTINPGANIQVGITVYNPQLTPRDYCATITIYDANMVATGAKPFFGTIDPYLSVNSSAQFTIPASASSGQAMIVGDVFSGEPKNGGIAYCLESTLYYWISRTESGLIGHPQPQLPAPQTTPGTYNAAVRLPTDPQFGYYTLYAIGQESPSSTSSTSATFSVQATSGYPPQASFIYWPAVPYLNQTVNFDASASTPEGYNDRITKYEWTFGDGTPKYVSTGNPPAPTAQHAYQQAGTFIVTLNVTDNEGLWCTTSKPIKILLDYGPTANFTWTPTTPYNNTDVVTFDGSSSTPGWSARTQTYPAIQSYAWNFGDGTPIMTYPNPTTTHMFLNPGDFTVTLTVTDVESRTGTLSQVIHVLLSTQSVKTYDVNHDGKINLIDVFQTALAYGSIPGSPNWNANCDVNHDGKVNLLDYFAVALHYGQDP
jgi:hypothetical protein